jgi:tripartite-type tricarboxylate transporter receptor subunit TctC
VRLVVPFAAGGSADIAARLVGLSLADRLGQQFIIESVGAEAPIS